MPSPMKRECRRCTTRLGNVRPGPGSDGRRATCTHTRNGGQSHSGMAATDATRLRRAVRGSLCGRPTAVMYHKGRKASTCGESAEPADGGSRRGPGLCGFSGVGIDPLRYYTTGRFRRAWRSALGGVRGGSETRDSIGSAVFAVRKPALPAAAPLCGRK